MRLGDLDALFREIKNSDWLPHERIEAMKMVRKQPTIDAVPVVRCKDCKYWQDNNGGYPNDECRWGKNETPDADDFCSYGERKDGE